MNYLNILICTIIFCFSLQAQDKKVDFPKDFFGKYTGTLDISSTKGSQQYPMEFHLLPSDTLGKYTYTLVYGEGETKQVRDYKLIEKDKEKGFYVVDENNGIILDDRVIDNRMYSLFEVNGTLLTTFITFEDTFMVFEIIATPTAEKNTTFANDENKTEVISYPIKTVQRAILQKQ